MDSLVKTLLGNLNKLPMPARQMIESLAPVAETVTGVGRAVTGHMERDGGMCVVSEDRLAAAFSEALTDALTDARTAERFPVPLLDLVRTKIGDIGREVGRGMWSQRHQWAD